MTTAINQNTRPEQLADLIALMREPGSFLTVQAATGSMVHDDSAGPSRVMVRDAAPVEEIPDEVIDEIMAAIQAQPPEVLGVVVVAHSSGVRLVESLPELPAVTFARFGALAAIAAVLEHRQAAIAFIHVVIDQLGADLVWSHTADNGDRSGSSQIVGDDRPVTKIAAGGWSQKRFQQRVENNWQQTAAEVADEIVLIARMVQPRVITVAGSVRMVQLLRDRLPAEFAGLLRDVPGSRSEDGSAENRLHAADAWIRTAVAEDTVAVLQQFAQHHGQADRAADGPDSTLEALRESRVETLLVHDDPDDTRTAWYTQDEPSLVSLDPATLGGTNPTQGRLIDVAIRAALLRGANVRVVPEHGTITARIAALLRW